MAASTNEGAALVQIFIYYQILLKSKYLVAPIFFYSVLKNIRVTVNTTNCSYIYQP